VEHWPDHPLDFEMIVHVEDLRAIVAAADAKNEERKRRNEFDPGVAREGRVETVVFYYRYRPDGPDERADLFCGFVSPIGGIDGAMALDEVT